MRLQILSVIFLCSVNLEAQQIEKGVFAVITFERHLLNKVETYYWVASEESIISEQNGRFCLYPLYLASEKEITWTPLYNCNGDTEYCKTDPFCRKVMRKRELIQRVKSKHCLRMSGSNHKIRPIERVSIYLTFVSGHFLSGYLQTNNVINKWIPIKAYAPLGDIETISMNSDEAVYLRAKVADYQGIAFSITSLASYPLDRELSKAYQEPYQ